jgi:6-phosphogluconolactonase (cycloisomerase 2 family)
LLQVATLNAAVTNAKQVIPKFLYVANSESDNISAFAVNPETGELKEVAGSPFPAIDGVSTLAATPDGNYLFAGGESAPSLATFQIDEAGRLRPLPGTAIPEGVKATQLEVSGAGTFLFVVDRENGMITTFRVDGKSGQLTKTSAPSLKLADGLRMIAADASGRFLFAADAAGDKIRTVGINPETGELAEVPGSEVATDGQPRALALSSGSLFVPTSKNTVPVYSFADQNGRLAAMRADSLEGLSTAAPFSAALSSTNDAEATVKLDPSGRFVYLADAQANHLTVHPLAIRPDSPANAIEAGSYLTGAAPRALAMTSGVVPNATGSISVSLANPNLLTFSSTTGTVHLGAAAQNTGGSACNGQIIQLAFSVPSIAVISTAAANPATSVCVATGAQDASFNVTTSKNSGSATLTAFATGFTDGTTSVSVALRAISLSLPDTNIGAGHTVSGTLTLANAAPSGGVTIALASSAPNAATISPSSVTIAAGGTSASFTVTGVAANPATLTATVASGGYSQGTLAITVVPPGQTINLPHNFTVGPGQSLPYPISIGAAGSSAVSITLSSIGGPGTATFSPNPVTIAAGATTPAVQPKITGGHIGSLSVTGHATGFASDTEAATVSITLTLSPATQSVQIGKTATLTLSASAVAPAGGFVINTAMDDPTRATVPAIVTIPQGTSFATVTITGVAAGKTTLRASAAGAVAASAAITVNSTPGINLYSAGSSSFAAGKNAVISMYGLIGVAAPAGNLNVTLTSSNSSALLLSKTQTGAGSASITVQVAAGSTSIPTFYAQALAGSGTAVVTGTATGYSSGSATATFVPSGFIVGSNTTTTTFSPASPVFVTFAQLDPATLNYVGALTLRPGLGTVTVALKNSNTAVGTLGASSVGFVAGNSTVSTTFKPTGTATGVAVISFNGTPSGFSTPANYQMATFTVNTPNSGMSSCLTSGYTTLTGNLGKNAVSCGVVPILAAAAPSGGRTVTVTSSNTAAALLSTAATTAGTGTVTVNVAAGASSGAAFYIQALVSSGTVTITETIPGYNTAKLTLTLVPSGFIVTPNTTTTTFSQASPVSVTFEQLDPATLNYVGVPLALRPGLGTVNVALKNSNTAVGTLGASSVAFAAGNSTLSTTFKPTGTAAGTAVISFNGTPSGFSTPANYQTATFTVNAPNSGMSSCLTSGYTTLTGNLGKNAVSCGVVPILAVAAPSGGRTVTISSSNTAAALLSTTSTTVGTGSVTVNVAAGASSGTAFYIQSLVSSGTVTITETVPGYNTAKLTLTLTPSGFIVTPNTTTTTFSPASPVSVSFEQLDPTTLNYVGVPLALRPGLGTVNVVLKNSNTAVGTLGSSSVAFVAGNSTLNTTFKPTGTAAGTAVITFNATPSGFSTPANYQAATFTVNAPNSGMSSCLTSGYTTLAGNLGKNAVSCAVVPILAAAAPSGGRTVTITSSNTAAALLSTVATTVGTGTVTVNVAAGASSGPAFYIQVLASTGTVTITETVPGYNNTTLTLTMVPSGFIVSPNTTTTTFSPASPVSVTFEQLDPATLNYIGVPLALRPGLGTVNVALKNSNTAVGTLGASSLAFVAGNSTLSTTFKPTGTAAGTAVIGFNGTPSGFSTPSNYQTATFIVNAPNTGMSSCLTSGYTTLTGNLGKNAVSCVIVPILAAAAPTGGRTVTITSSNTAAALLSTVATTAGTGTVTVNVAAGASSGPAFYIQALASSGTVTITETAPGYNTSSLTLTLVPSGFIVGSNTTTTTFSPASPVSVTFEQLDPTTLNYVGVPLALRPGLGTVNVALKNSNTAVGTLGSSSIAFVAGNSNVSTTFTPTGTAAGTAVISFNGTPSGFSTPSNYQTATFTVNAPPITIQPVTVGKNLQTTTFVTLGAAVPAGGRTITIQSPNSALAVLSSSPATTGTTTLTFTLAAGQSATPQFYVQAHSGSGTVTLTASSPGYANGSGVITLYPGGFALQGSNFTTHLTDNPTTLTIVPAALDPTFLNVYQVQLLNPNQPNTAATVTLTDQSGTSPVGKVTLNPVLFQGDDSPNLRTTSFQPLHAGSTLIKVTSPSGFSNASSQITATVQP